MGQVRTEHIAPVTLFAVWLIFLFPALKYGGCSRVSGGDVFTGAARRIDRKAAFPVRSCMVIKHRAFSCPLHGDPFQAVVVSQRFKPGQDRLGFVIRIPVPDVFSICTGAEVVDCGKHIPGHGILVGQFDLYRYGITVRQGSGSCQRQDKRQQDRQDLFHGRVPPLV